MSLSFQQCIPLLGKPLDLAHRFMAQDAKMGRIIIRTASRLAKARSFAGGGAIEAPAGLGG
jgi:hypothetical protein